MKLLVLAPQPFFQDRGTPIATMKMLHVLSIEGHDIDLLTYHEGSEISVSQCTHKRIPSIPFVRNVPPGFSFRKLICDFVMTFCVFRLCLRNKYDVIHAVEESVFMAMLAKFFFRIPYIYDMDSSLPLQISDQMPVLRFLFPLLSYCECKAIRGSIGVVAVCQALEDLAASHCEDVPIVRIEDASLITVEQENAQPNEPGTALKLEGRVIMYVGNLQTYQGIDLLLHAFTHVYHRHHDAQLVVIGGSAEEIQKYRHIAQSFAIADRTHFLGSRPIELLGAYLEQADILVSPRTLGSNTPMKVYSYLESGIPLLATRLAMHTQVLDEQVAVLTEPTPLDMARGLSVLLENKELRDNISKAARQRVEEHYRPEILDMRLSEFYHELAVSLGHEA